MRDLSKKILRTALWNDSRFTLGHLSRLSLIAIAALFLSNLNVMDYSLVVGIDEEKGELVVGIVDYIRTFTW